MSTVLKDLFSYDPYAKEPDGCSAKLDEWEKLAEECKAMARDAQSTGRNTLAAELYATTAKLYLAITQYTLVHVQHRVPVTRKAYYGRIWKRLMAKREKPEPTIHQDPLGHYERHGV